MSYTVDSPEDDSPEAAAADHAEYGVGEVEEQVNEDAVTVSEDVVGTNENGTQFLVAAAGTVLSKEEAEALEVAEDEPGVEEVSDVDVVDYEPDPPEDQPSDNQPSFPAGTAVNLNVDPPADPVPSH